MSQDLLVRHLKQLFPGHDTIVNARKQSQAKYPSTGRYLELDVWIPELNLGFEFQDNHHYVSQWYYHAPMEKIRDEDYVKKEVVHQKEISLVIIPCWWVGDINSLVATIRFYRPDLNSYLSIERKEEVSSYMPIILNPPRYLFDYKEIPEVGELMAASFPLQHELPHNLWWIGEKYDGVRYCWNPTTHKSYTRAGREVSLKSSVMHALPQSLVIDGEYWFGRGHFSSTYPLCNSSSDDAVEWDSLRLIAFDAPSRELEDKTYEERYKLLLSHVNHDFPLTVVPSRVMFASDTHLTSFVQAVISDGGEGAILGERGAVYRNGRSSSLLKLKAFSNDKEGIITEVSDHDVILKLPEGKTLHVPLPSVKVPNLKIGELKIGDIVSFSFDVSARRSLPLHPSIYRVRADLEWNDVLTSHAKERQFISDQSHVRGFTQHPPRYWTVTKLKEFLENLAKSKNLDPLLASTWYSIPYTVVSKFKGGKALLHKFGGYFNSLRHLFPEIGFEKKTWSDINARRAFFEKYARKNKFDPLVAKNWYSQSRRNIMSMKGAKSLITYHSHSVYTALLDLFPNIGLEKSKLYKQYWSSAENRKKYFEEYATRNGFDALLPDNWYALDKNSLLARKEISHIINYHNESLNQALLDLFPDIGLDRTKLFKPFIVREHRKQFFVNYAAAFSFDPLNPNHWYDQSRDKILSFKGGGRVIAYHNGSVSQALLDLFPDIGFIRARWTHAHRLDNENRRKLSTSYTAAAASRHHSTSHLVPL